MAAEDQRVRDAKKAMAKRNSKKTHGDAKKTAVVICVVATGLGFLLMAMNPAKGGASPVNDESLVDHVNRNAKTWTAATAPMFNGWHVSDVKELGAVQWRDQDYQWHLCPPATADAPDSFDSREKWPTCFQDRHIYEAGNCSASWAIAAASLVATRFCINEPDKYPGLTLSPQSLLSCDQSNDGCKGGGMDTVWNYLESDGLVSESCFPMSGWNTECSAACDELPMKINAKCAVQGLDPIKREIAANGPVAAQIVLSDELFIYKSGVFVETPTAQHFTGKRQDSRKKKVVMALIIGWGSDGDEEYWIIENSFGKGWGEDGYAKIAMGKVGEPGQQSPDNVVNIDVVFVGAPTNHKYGQPAASDYGDLDIDEDLDDIDLDLDLGEDDDLFADLDLDEAEE